MIAPEWIGCTFRMYMDRQPVQCLNLQRPDGVKVWVVVNDRNMARITKLIESGYAPTPVAPMKENDYTL